MNVEKLRNILNNFDDKLQILIPTEKADMFLDDVKTKSIEGKSF